MKIENLENELISFELSDEDVQAIKGGSTADNSVDNSVYTKQKPFPIRITAIRIFPIVIYAQPVIDS